jgi:CheY-like chemotaxis protein
MYAFPVSANIGSPYNTGKNKTKVKFLVFPLKRRFSMEKRSVLVVDDNPSTCFAYISLLKLSGFAAMHALNGHDALELFASDSKKFGVVITDYKMPLMNGLELCAALNAISSVPVLLCSGSREATDGEDVRFARFNEIFQKPIDYNRMLESVRGYLT